MSMTGSLVVLALAWIAWCVVHSLLVAGPARRWGEARLGTKAGAYRLLYNLFALVTLAPLLLYARGIEGPVRFDWWGAGVPVSAALFVLAMVFFYTGARSYDMATFLGLRQIRRRREPAGVERAGSGGAARGGEAQPANGSGLHASGGISREGMLGLVRHPWYTGGILFLWVGPKNAAALVTATILTGYLILGAYLEERRLLVEFGSEYRQYQREVGMFVPFPRIRRRVAEPRDPDRKGS